MANDYKGKVNFYKVNIEKVTDMAAMFGVRSVPTIIMITTDARLAQIPGVPDKVVMAETIDTFLNIEIEDGNDN